MKKIYLILIAAFFIAEHSYAQTNTPWSTTGNIGIGTLFPFSILDVAPSSNAHVLTTSTASDHPAITFADVNGNPQHGTIKTYDFLITNGTTNFMQISSVGKVGIGIINPLGLLSLNNQIANGNTPVNYITNHSMPGQSVFNSIM